MRPTVSRRVDDVDATAEDADRVPRLEGAFMHRRVDTQSQTADDGEATPGQVAAETARHIAAVGGTAPGADNGDARGVERLCPPPHEQIHRWVVDLSQQRRIVCVVKGDELRPQLDAARQLLLCCPVGARSVYRSPVAPHSFQGRPCRTEVVQQSRATGVPHARQTSQSQQRQVEVHAPTAAVPSSTSSVSCPSGDVSAATCTPTR